MSLWTCAVRNWLVLPLCLASVLAPQASVNQLPDKKGLLDPLTMNDGSRVRNQEDWKKRREEIKEVFDGQICNQETCHPLANCDNTFTARFRKTAAAGIRR